MMARGCEEGRAPISGSGQSEAAHALGRPEGGSGLAAASLSPLHVSADPGRRAEKESEIPSAST